jgi:hypothetical protein
MVLSDDSHSDVKDTPGVNRALVKHLYRYIWSTTARSQMYLSALSIAVFLLELAPLELQRRIVNGAVAQRGLKFILMLCLAYVGVAVLHGALKFVMSVYRGSVTEGANRRLRLRIDPTGNAQRDDSCTAKGIKVSIVVSEVEAVGGFRRLELLRSAAQCGDPGQRLRLHDRRAAVDGAGGDPHLPAAAALHSLPAERDQPPHEAPHQEAARNVRRHRERTGRA